MQKYIKYYLNSFDFLKISLKISPILLMLKAINYDPTNMIIIANTFSLTV